MIVQPATPNEVVPLVAMAYGLTERESHVVRLCMQGRSTRQMAADLHVSAYTVQDHFTSIFDETGVRSRNELVGQIFLEHYAPAGKTSTARPDGWPGRPHHPDLVR